MKSWLTRRLISRTNVLMAGCALFLVGLVLARFGFRLPLWFVISAAVPSLLLHKRPVVFTITILFMCLSLGVWRGGNYFVALQPFREFSYHKIAMRAVALDDAVYANNGQLSFMVSDIKFVSPSAVKAPGKIKIKGYGELAVNKGDILYVTGKLYPTRGAAQASIGFASFNKIGGGSSLIDDFRRRFVAGIQTALPEPAASFGMGLLVGQRATLPEDITMSLKMVGLTHIIAVSGYNLTVLLNAAKRIMGKRSKRITTGVAIALMVLFLIITGASASIVRAAVVSGLGLLAWYYGRQVRPMVLILLAAVLTAAWNPVYLWSDIGWYLSFLAFFGILVLAPQVFKRLWREKQPSIVAQIAVETMCAEVMTLPLILFIFGQVSLVGLLANMLVISAIPLAMLFSFIAGLSGMIWPLFSGWFAWPANIILTYMLDVAVGLSRIPNIFQKNQYISVIDMALCYGLIVAVTVLLYRPKQQKWTKMIDTE